ncbi:MAG: GLPGLI family protein [Flavobacterium sp.]|nr:MAG: GLPGLI family protein [Flavobacterium sp.]
MRNRNSMRATVVLWFVLCLPSIAQNKKVVYVEYATIKVTAETSSNLEPVFKQGVDTFVNVLESITFELVANDSIAVFKKIEKLPTDEPHPLSKILGNGTYFTNLKSKEKIKIIDASGQAFSVVVPFDEYQWEITSETKTINGFKCYKAKTQKEKYVEWRNETIITEPEVWFSPEIPFRFGPFGLIGLPGLILEASLNGKVYYHATKIDLDYKLPSTKELRRPNKGKFVTEKEMEQITMKMDSRK